MRTCVECGREFDLYNETDAAEWYYGHDCEPLHREIEAELPAEVLS